MQTDGRDGIRGAARFRAGAGPSWYPRTVLLATDTHYDSTHAATAGVLFDDWTAGDPVRELVCTSALRRAEYKPGSLYLRELPGILELLDTLDTPPDAIVIDAYVWLDGAGTPGLGAQLYETLERQTPIIGVAKTAFAGSSHAVAITRGDSRRPLYVTAAGVDADRAGQWIAGMHGPHRIPTLLKRADRLCRAAVTS